MLDKELKERIIALVHQEVALVIQFSPSSLLSSALLP